MTAASSRASQRDRMGAVIIVVLAIVAGIVAAVAGSPRTPASADVGSTASGLTPEDFASRTVLVIHQNPAQATDLVALYSFESAEKGNVILLPPSTLADVPSIGTQPLADVVKVSSADMLEVTVENLLGVGIDEVVVLDDDRLTNAFAPSGRFEVDLPHALEINDEDGTVALPQGKQSLPPVIAGRALRAAEPDELAHQATIQAVLEGWRATLGDQRDADAVLLSVPALSTFVAHAPTELHYETLPAARDEIGELVDDRFSWAALNAGDARPRVTISDGAGTPGLTAAAAQLVVPAGGEVVGTDSVPGFGVLESQVGYTDDANRAAAENIAAALGIATVAQVTELPEDVDLRVILGTDFVPPP